MSHARTLDTYCHEAGGRIPNPPMPIHFESTDDYEAFVTSLAASYEQAIREGYTSDVASGVISTFNVIEDGELALEYAPTFGGGQVVVDDEVLHTTICPVAIIQYTNQQVSLDDEDATLEEYAMHALMYDLEDAIHE